MALSELSLSLESFVACVAHALITEHEEVMGLLAGHWESASGGRVVAHVSDVIVLSREDRRKDRVEVSAVQLSIAAEEAEAIQRSRGRAVQIVGWYHSHPHITVQPSAVDIRTQLQYQVCDGSADVPIHCVACAVYLTRAWRQNRPWTRALRASSWPVLRRTVPRARAACARSRSRPAARAASHGATWC